MPRKDHTQRSEPIAQRIPDGETRRQDRREVIAAMRALAENVPPWDKASYRELIEGGRRF